MRASSTACRARAAFYYSYRAPTFPRFSTRALSTTHAAMDVLKLPTWLKQSADNSHTTAKPLYPVNDALTDRIALYQGDITKLKCDAVVNAANSQLAHGGGICGAIFSAAGSRALSAECSEKHPRGCPTGSTVLTSGHKLPAMYILHTVAPQDQSASKMQSCYQSIYKLCTEHKLQSVAICCIGTGIYGFPADEACQIALENTRKFLEDDSKSSQMQRIVFCTFGRKDTEIYKQYLPAYFPTSNSSDGDAAGSGTNSKM